MNERNRKNMVLRGLGTCLGQEVKFDDYKLRRRFKGTLKFNSVFNSFLLSINVPREFSPRVVCHYDNAWNLHAIEKFKSNLPRNNNCWHWNANSGFCQWQFSG